MPPNLSVSELKQLGIQHYKQKQYQKALDAFTGSIDASLTDSIDLLDLRSATFLKLENFDRALQDSRRMIKIDKRNVKGYLRTGQILQKMSKPAIALDIYSYGARNVPVADTNYILLKTTRDKLQRELAPPKSLDPLTVLPVELAEMVLNFLSFRNRVICLRVSGNWYRFIGSRETLWTKIDLSHARGLVKASFVRHCIDRARNKVTEVTLHRVDDVHILRALATKCPKLGIINIVTGPSLRAGESILEAAMCAKNLKTLELSEHMSISMNTIVQILRRRPTLVNLVCLNINCRDRMIDWTVDLPCLRKLVLHASLEVTDVTLVPELNLSSLFERAPNITYLSLSRFRGHLPVEPFSLLTSLETIILDRIAIPNAMPVPTTIRKITLTHNNRIAYGILTPFNMPAIIDPNLIHIPPLGVPQLTDLEISYHYSLSQAWPGLLELLGDQGEASVPTNDRPTPRLTRFSLQDSAGIDEGLDLSAAQVRARLMALLSLPALGTAEELCLASARLTDAEIVTFPRIFPDLKSLDLSRTNVTGVSVKALVEGLKGLSWLGVNECMTLTADAVEWARSKGLTVQHSFGSKAKSGKRLVGAY